MEGQFLYRRSQHSRNEVMVPIMCGLLLIAFAAGLRAEAQSIFPILAGAAVITVVLLGSRRLTVSVSPSEVVVEYTFGWPRKQISRSEIVSAEPFRVPWWYGVGIRLTPKGWLWSVWGFRTVMLTLSNGKHFLIGTDDPEGLAAALR